MTTIVNTTVPDNATIIQIDTSDTATTKVFFLPTVTQSNSGKVYIFKDIYGAASTNIVYISTTAATDRIDGQAKQKLLQTSYGSIMFMSDGTSNWRTVNSYLGQQSQTLI
jgi:hypothetical protein